MRNSIRVIAFLCIAVGSVVIVFAQSERSRTKVPHKTKFGELNDVAYRARGNDGNAVRALTDGIVDQTAPFEVPKAHSLRARLFRAEHEYRKGKHRGVTERDLENAINEGVDAVHGPRWARTNTAQLHLFRTALKPHVPQVIGQKKGPRGPFDISEEMSPGEAVFVGLLLGNGKLTDPEYQVEPDQWVERIRAERERRKQERASKPRGNSSEPQAYLVGRVESTEMMALHQSVSNGLKDEDTEVSRQAHTFLDRLGIQR